MDLLHALTLGDLLREHRRNYPERTAVVCRDDRYTFPELDDRVNRLAAVFHAAGVGSGDRILWLGQNCHRLLEGLLAAAKVGAVFCPVNWRQSADEMAFVIGDVDPAVVLWQEEEIGETVRAARAAAAEGGRATWLQIDDPAGYEAALTAHDPTDPADLADRGDGVGAVDPVPVDATSPVLMMYTAAFSGQPNGAQLSHTALILQGLMMGMLQEITADYVYLNCGPLFHVATFMTTAATFVYAGTNVFTRRVDAEELCRIVAAEHCTGAFLMGPTIGQIVELNADRRYDLSSLRTFRGSAEWNEMITVDTSPWATRPAGYGQTEVMGMLTFNALGAGSTGTSGRASPLAQVRIFDPEGHEVAPGETGEIVARGPTIMNGYHNRADLNTERQRGGWHHTNDIGRRELDGSITFVGPKTRLIKSAAENIYPAEVEGCIGRHPAVAEVAIIGVPDKKWTQSVKAIVVLKDGTAATADDIIEHCRTNIASYKKPRHVEFVDKLPRQGWAIDYEALDAAHGGGGYPGA